MVADWKLDSPVSGSAMVKVPEVLMLLLETATSSCTAPVSVPAMTAVSLVLLITMLNVSLITPPLPSLAVRVTEVLPTSLFSGVPLNVRVAASNDNHPDASDV